jgi:transcriptional regulator with XRE-family HTH domain
MAPITHITRNIRLLGVYHGYSMTAVASYLGVTKQTVTRRLHGDSPWPQPELAELAQLFGVVTLDAPYLIFGPDGPKAALTIDHRYGPAPSTEAVA